MNLPVLLDRSTPWLSWWQELILNWVATWQSIDYLQVTSNKADAYAEWDAPCDLELKRMELEELLDTEPGRR